MFKQVQTACTLVFVFMLACVSGFPSNRTDEQIEQVPSAKNFTNLPRLNITLLHEAMSNESIPADLEKDESELLDPEEEDVDGNVNSEMMNTKALDKSESGLHKEIDLARESAELEKKSELTTQEFFHDVAETSIETSTAAVEEEKEIKEESHGEEEEVEEQEGEKEDAEDSQRHHGEIEVVQSAEKAEIERARELLEREKEANEKMMEEQERVREAEEEAFEQLQEQQKEMEMRQKEEEARLREREEEEARRVKEQQEENERREKEEKDEVEKEEDEVDENDDEEDKK